jgi:putative NADPH-quinone reductase
MTLLFCNTHFTGTVRTGHFKRVVRFGFTAWFRIMELKAATWKGKQVLTVLTTGGNKEFYSKEGRNKFTINEFLVPFRQSANLCLMEYLPPYVIYGSHTITPAEIEVHTSRYKKIANFALRDNQLDNFAHLSRWNT